ncbi:MAG TPA: hypothetical protein VGL44_14700 [Gaiellales bacterium]
MQGVLAALRRRPVAGTGVALAALWLVIVAVEITTSPPYERAGWYATLLSVVDSALRGVLGAAALVWLIEHGRE